MKRRPAILIAPGTAREGSEFSDASISLSHCYARAVIAAGGLPQIFAATTNRPVITESVERCDGVLMTGGEDIDPKLYAKALPEEAAKKVGPLEPDRDSWEKDVIADALEQEKPILGICRGHQMLNVVLGGTLVADIATQVPGALNHLRMDRKGEPVHEVEIAPDSLFARVTGRRTLGVNSTHHQAIGALAGPLRAAARSSDGVIEAAEWKEPGRQPFLLLVQFHPERLIDRNPLFLQIFSSFVAACEQRQQRNL
jgi:putative glutamine amidotransferase